MEHHLLMASQSHKLRPGKGSTRCETANAYDGYVFFVKVKQCLGHAYHRLQPLLQRQRQHLHRCFKLADCYEVRQVRVKTYAAPPSKAAKPPPAAAPPAAAPARCFH